jgi:hypothetical protein
MTAEAIERLKWYVTETRKGDVIAASNSRLNGYNTIAMEHQNRAALADLILADIAKEFGG